MFHLSSVFKEITSHFFYPKSVCTRDTHPNSHTLSWSQSQEPREGSALMAPPLLSHYLSYRCHTPLPNPPKTTEAVPDGIFSFLPPAGHMGSQQKETVASASSSNPFRSNAQSSREENLHSHERELAVLCSSAPWSSCFFFTHLHLSF